MEADVIQWGQGIHGKAIAVASRRQVWIMKPLPERFQEEAAQLPLDRVSTN